MVHWCVNCPGTTLKSFLDNEFSRYDSDEEFYFEQWQTTDRTTLSTQTTSLEEHKESIVYYKWIN